MLPLLGGHAAVSGSGRCAHLARAAAQRLFRGRREGAEAHSGDRDRDLELEGLLGKPRPDRHVRIAALPIALERVAGDARAQEEEVVEVGQAPFRAEAADVVDPLAGGALDLGNDRAVVEVRLAQIPGALFSRRHQ